VKGREEGKGEGRKGRRRDGTSPIKKLVMSLCCIYLTIIIIILFAQIKLIN